MAGSILHLFLKPAHGQAMSKVESVHAVSGRGLQGDTAFDRSRRQVLLIDRATLEAFDLEPGQTRENIVVSGIRLSGLPPGTRLHVGEALLEITGDCTPCEFMDTLRPGLRRAIRGNRGLLARVTRGGVIRVGDPVDLASESTA